MGLSVGGIARNCLIVSNTYGVYFYATRDRMSTWFENCTVASNTYGILMYFDSRNTNPCYHYAINSIIYYNTTNWTYSDTNVFFTNSCTYPMPTNALGELQNTSNITNEPVFAERSSRNYRLGGSSPCINTGTNRSWMTGRFDLDGRVRIRYGRVDMGAYERLNSGTIYGFW